MVNVEIKVKGDTIIIRINKKKSFGPSKSGKTITVASTKGNKPIEGTDLILGLNCYKYPEDD
ncbi:hypothetical protein DRH13_05910 [Candidatus Woesebacteria bacterium]|nr:MAG: hypothetical protein DRH13_05910 [Candidatus Woesebacteria bacterium]